MPWDESLAILLDKQHHIRLRALLIELHMYRVEWVVGENRWELGGPVFMKNSSTDTTLKEGEMP